MDKYDLSVVLGSKNRKNLLELTIKSIRENGFEGKMEIIVVDGGSIDGTCDWLAKQRDIFTIVQPNYKINDNEGISVLAHSWGEFMNIGFRFANSSWIVMVSDDLILTKGVLQSGYNILKERQNKGEKIGGGAFYFREYPRHSFYRIGLLPGNIINVNHGFINKKALLDINFIDDKNYNFYCGDADLSIRLHNNGWKIISLDNCFAEHLTHLPGLRSNSFSPATLRDIETFKKKYPDKCDYDCHKKLANISNDRILFWKAAFFNCFLALFLKFIDKYRNVKNGKWL